MPKALPPIPSWLLKIQYPRLSRWTAVSTPAVPGPGSHRINSPIYQFNFQLPFFSFWGFPLLSDLNSPLLKKYVLLYITHYIFLFVMGGRFISSVTLMQVENLVLFTLCFEDIVISHCSEPINPSFSLPLLVPYFNAPPHSYLSHLWKI